MFPAANSRRGMTLAELMVTMAMVAIMIVMVVSFVTLITGHTQMNGQRLAFQQDYAVLKSQVEAWMDTNAGTELTWDNQVDDTDWYRSVKAEGSTLSLQYNTLTAGSYTYRVETIESVTFRLEVKGEDENRNYLLFCAVTGVNGEHYTFCVNPHVGETVGAP